MTDRTAVPRLSDPAWALERATLSDLPAIVAIYNATIPSRRVTADTEPVSVESRLPWFEAHTKATRPLWVLRPAAGGAMAGWLSFSDFHPRPAYHRTAELSIYLDEAARGRGLGAMVLQAAIHHAPGIEVDTLVGLIFGHNVPSLALFHRFGFTDWGTYPRVAVLDGIERDLVVVGRRLAD